MASETLVEEINLKWLADRYPLDPSHIDYFAEDCLSAVKNLLDEISQVADMDKEKVPIQSYNLIGLAKDLVHNSQTFLMAGKLSELYETLREMPSENKDIGMLQDFVKGMINYDIGINSILSETEENRLYVESIGIFHDLEKYFCDNDVLFQIMAKNYQGIFEDFIGNKDNALELFEECFSILEELGLEDIWEKVSNDRVLMIEWEYNLLKLGRDVAFNIAVSEYDSLLLERQLNFLWSADIGESVYSHCPSDIENTSAKIALLDSYSEKGYGMIIDDNYLNSKRDINYLFNCANKMHNLIRPTESIEPFLQSFNTFKKAYDLKKNRYKI